MLLKVALNIIILTHWIQNHNHNLSTLSILKNNLVLDINKVVCSKINIQNCDIIYISTIKIRYQIITTEIRTGYSKHWKSNTTRYISFHYVSCVNKTTCYKICKQNAGAKRLFLFCLFYFYLFMVYKIILILPFVSFFLKFTCVEFQVRIMLHFAYMI